MRLSWLALFLVCPEAALDDVPNQEGGFSLFDKRPKFVSWSRGLESRGKFERLFTPDNGIGTPPAIQDQDFLKGLQSLRDIVAEAEVNGKRLRAYGSRFSTTKVNYNTEWLVDSQGLNYIKVGIDDATEVAPGYLDKSGRLVFVQAGVNLRRANRFLLENGLALKTSSATDGQRIVGAASTGTHGANSEAGSVQDMVRGIHLVIPGRHVFVQRASDPVVTAAYAESLGGAEFIESDALFKAAVTSFGSFGLIHGMLIEADPLYRVQGSVRRITKEEGFAILEDFDVAKVGLPGLTEYPMHFEMSFSPFGLTQNDVFVRYFNRVPLSEEEIEEIKGQAREGSLAESPIAPSKDMYRTIGEYFSSAQSILGLFTLPKRIIYGLGVDFILTQFYNAKEDNQLGFPGDIFFSGDSEDKTFPIPLSLTGTEVSFAPERTREVVDIMLGIIEKYPLAAPISLRLVKRTDATLAFTNRPNTPAGSSLPPVVQQLNGVIELPGPYARFIFHDSHKIHQRIFDALAATNISHAYHWGQHFPENKEWVRNAFGAGLDEFKAQRELLLGAAGMEMFNNEKMEILGISD